MERLDLVAVAERVGDQGWRREGGVLVRSRVSRAGQVEADGAEPGHDAVGVEVLGCLESGEEPRAYRA